MSHRVVVRRAAAVLSAVVALVYLLIGFGVLTVVEPAADAPDLLAFGLSAGAAFALGAFLLLAFDRRALWVLGAIFQALVIVMYVQVAPQRTPPFELWGLGLKVAQAVILAALAWLVVDQSAGPAERRSAAA